MSTTTESVPLKKASSVSGYLRHIFSSDFESDTEDVVSYRGQSDSGWSLVPSILRGYQDNAESKVFRELMLEAPDEFSNDKLMFDRLVRAQHYGLPTRLLDVSLNPLVALYFACCEYKNKCAGKVFIIRFSKERVKFSDSDTISLISNLTKLSDNDKLTLSKNRKSSIVKFKNLNAVNRLISHVKGEKPYFINEIERTDLFRYFFIYPAKNNSRVIAQSGAFMFAGLLKYEKPESAAGIIINEIIIPAGDKGKIIEQLDKLNINSRTLFPEIEAASKYISNKYKISSE